MTLRRADDAPPVCDLMPQPFKEAAAPLEETGTIVNLFVRHIAAWDFQVRVVEKIARRPIAAVVRAYRNRMTDFTSSNVSDVNKSAEHETIAVCGEIRRRLRAGLGQLS